MLNQPALLLQGDELQLLAGLASDAAGLLWELAAMHDTGEAATDMLTKSEQLQVQNTCKTAFVTWFLAATRYNHEGLACHIAFADSSCNSITLQAQLRGMISDFTDADESAIAAALGAFETLTNSLDEFKKSQTGGVQTSAQEPQLPASTRGAAPSGAPFKLQPPPGGSGSQAPGQKPADEAPLISFD